MILCPNESCFPRRVSFAPAFDCSLIEERYSSTNFRLREDSLLYCVLPRVSALRIAGNVARCPTMRTSVCRDLPFIFSLILSLHHHPWKIPSKNFTEGYFSGRTHNPSSNIEPFYLRSLSSAEKRLFPRQPCPRR